MIEVSDYFSIEIFFIILRETLETAIIISVLLSFINQRSHSHDGSGNSVSSQRHAEEQRKLRLQVGGCCHWIINMPRYRIDLYYMLLYYW